MKSCCRNCCKIFCNNRDTKDYCDNQITFRQAGQIDKLERGKVMNNKIVTLLDFKEHKCPNCKNCDSSLCRITYNINGEPNCVYYEEGDKE